MSEFGRKIEIEIRGAPKIRISYANRRFFVARKDADFLENSARVCVTNVNFNANNWSYNSNLWPIIPEMVAVLCEFGFSEVFRQDSDVEFAVPFEMIDFEESVEFANRRITARDLWRKGYYISDGSRFGGDFLVYLRSPNQTHAEHVVLCLTGNNCDEMRKIAAMRVCNQVKKSLILSNVLSNFVPHYTKCDWFRAEGESRKF